ncbi:hypothetical protein DSL64_02780 [Dyadobacter luteus]|uniref:VanZ-like domain-containing protein n=1 Tax=Dyadobacter luteus TaxID=2259619 RepID=A0A3D8YI12_9BACT|nr:hypothetical protein [Dyadobacter luteus]REA64489.1 hypothetical protein DSL64_02780 [Dyadobacter luteus]
MSRILTILTVAVLGLSVLFFSWLPHPDIGSLPIFPHWLGKWINHYGNLRTAVPFFLATTFLGITIDKESKHWRRIFPGSLVLVTVAELGQLLLPKRHFDLWDIVWGMVGAISGMTIAIISKTITSRCKTSQP